MAKLRVPSIQHMARNYRDDPSKIHKALVRLAEHPPTFNYNALFAAVRDLLALNVPYEQVVDGITRIARADVRENLLSVMPLIQEHFSDVSPDFVQTVARRYYPVGRGLMVPFEPPLMYGVGGQFYFPWFSFWRSNPLATEKLSLFVTLVDEVLLQDPDLDHARFEILDFSAPKVKAPRELKIIDARDVPRLDDARKKEMLDIFAEGYFRALEELSMPKPGDMSDKKPSRESSYDPDQPTFFDLPK